MNDEHTNFLFFLSHDGKNEVIHKDGVLPPHKKGTLHPIKKGADEMLIKEHDPSKLSFDGGKIVFGTAIHKTAVRNNWNLARLVELVIFAAGMSLGALIALNF